MINFDPSGAWEFAQAIDDGSEDVAIQAAFKVTSVPGAVEMADHDIDLPKTVEELSTAIRDRLKMIHTAPVDVTWGVLIPEVLGLVLGYLEDFNAEAEDEVQS